MRILLVASHLPSVLQEAAALHGAGHQVELFVFDSGCSAAGIIAQAVALRDAIRRMRPEVVHSRSGKSTALAAACAAAGLAPLVVSFRGTDIGHNTRYSVLRSALGAAASQIAALFAAGIVCPTAGMRDRVLARHWRRSLVTPGGVDLQAFAPADRAAARAGLGFGPDERIVLFHCGGNPAMNDPELAAQALDDARRRVGALRLVLLDGSAPPEDLPHYLNAADCLLVTSKAAAPAAVQEAMACNLPIVSAAAAGRCPIALGMALAGLLRAPVRSDARQHVLGVEAVAARLGAFYEEIRVRARFRIKEAERREIGL